VHHDTTPKITYFNFTIFLLLAFMWSGSFLNIKIVVDVFPPVFSAMMRVLVSAVTLGVFFLATRKVIFIRSPLMLSVWLAGFFTQAIPFALLFYGEKFIAPALASIINSTVSLWALVLGALLYRDVTQLTPLKILGLILGFTGIVIIFLPLMSRGESSVIGIAAIMGMAISYAVGSLMNQHVIFKNRQISFETNLFQQHLSSLLFLITTSLTLETWPTWTSFLNKDTMLAFLYLGIVATAMAWMIYFYLIREWGAVRTASVMYIVPILAMFWDFLFLDFIPGHNELLGAAAILLGVTFVQWNRKGSRLIALNKT
jgi:drug/metabolite transporter (DMT)-like permease